MEGDQIKESVIIKQEVVFSGKWLGIKEITYSHGGKILPNYEMAFRTTRNQEYGIDGIGIYPIIKYKEKPSQIVVIANFRPPTGKFILEFPAGLAQSSNFEQDARRQCQEETGYVPKSFLKILNPITFVDPYKSPECGHGFVAIIDGDDPDSHKGQGLTGNQNIRVLKFPIDKQLINNISKYAQENGFGIEQKVWLICVSLIVQQYI